MIILSGLRYLGVFIFSTFFVFFAEARRVPCDFPNYLVQCDSGQVCTSNKNYRCPSAVTSNPPVEQSTTSSSSSATPTNKTTTTKKSSSTSKSTVKKAAEPSSSSGSSVAESSSQSSCPKGTYPGKQNLLSKAVDCEPCPTNATIPGYCGLDESPTEGEASPTSQCAEKGGVWLADQNRCLNKDSCQSGEVWNEEVRDCVPSNTASASESGSCIQLFGESLEKCNTEASSAETSCNDENESMKAATNSAKVVGAGSAVSVQMACSKLGEVAKLANGALVGWQSYCAANQGGCENSCREAKRILESECIQEPDKSKLISSYLNSIKTNIQQCESYKVKIQEAAQHAAAALAQMKAAQQCKEDSSSTLQTNNLDQCKTNPNSPLCTDMQKCSNATFAAQNPVCTCVANPTSPSCLQAAASYQAGGLSSGANIAGTKNGKETGLNGLDPNANAADATNPLAGLGNAPSGDGQSVGGRQGDASSAGRANSNGGGGGVGGGNYGAGGGGAEKDHLKVNSGTLGGAPMGSGFFGKTNGGSGGSYGQLPNNGRRDIAKFDPRKYITGQGGKGEYINGANENIFKIVKMRYEDKKTTLLPENFSLKK
jgi:hypothetical protein